MQNNTSNINNNLSADFVIIGAGIAGLMLQTRLNNLGYSTLLLEHSKIGSGQTSKAQGIIHGGIKYALLGHITESAKEISKQPQKWQNYLDNTSDIDLSDTKIVSKYHDLYSRTSSIKDKLKQIVIQKTLSSHGFELLKDNPEYPQVFNNQDFKGKIFRVQETILDINSLLNNLKKTNNNKIIKIDYNSLKINLDTNKNIQHLSFTSDNQLFNISAQKYIFTAGQNNKQVLDLLPNMSNMQLRPLHMVMAKFPEPNIIFGHFIGNSMLPILTITTHKTKDNNYVWYIGGKIAEEGIYLNQEQQITQAKIKIKKHFPWLNTDHWQWSSFMVDRAEPLELNNQRPDKAFFVSKNNAIVAWPVKMALAPALSDKIINFINKNNITNKFKPINILDYNLTSPDIATPIWDKLF